MRHSLLLLLALMLAITTAAQQKPPDEADEAKPAAEKSAKSEKAEKPAPQKEEPPVVTHHEITVNGKVLRYTATVGYMPIRNTDNDEIEANIFYIAYTLDGAPAKRPLMFSFNGGPGSASVWLHLGAIGPRRVQDAA